ncbi:type II toxin-antitoxin system RelE/ParE family toxin [Streptomyces sp. S9]|nr:type II toxin-antitoxin system RelE/ParE family toxin [Streptomyces sp. S9]
MPSTGPSIGPGFTDHPSEVNACINMAGIDMLASTGPTLGRPLVDRIKGAENHHLKELRPGSSGSSEIRILFAFDPVRRAVLLVAGDKAGNWQRWYDINIPLAEERYRTHLADLETREYE